jgi:hypothetical protein
MKVTIDIDCTPEEARTFLGLPDIQPLQATLMAELEKRMRANIEQMDPETMLRTWLPAGLQGLEQMQKLFWSQLASAGAGAKPGDK